ncbi:MAG: S1C family serine protease [Clostridiales bacterium]|nr:S1C family serine protease [Clostridiales bacterium]
MKKWKKYGAAVLTGAVLIGVCAQGEAFRGIQSVIAEETEETQRVTLNIADDEEETEENADVKKTAADDTDEDVNETAEKTSETEDSDEEESEQVSLDVEDSSASDSDEEAAGDDAEEEISLGTGTSVAGVETSSGSIVVTDVSEIVENCMPSIVSITSVNEAAEEDEESDSDYYYYYAQDGSIVFEDADTDTDTETVEEESTASGIIIAQSNTELLIAVNYHVVSDADEILVGFSAEAENEDDLTVYGKIKGTSSATDLAVVAVDLSDIEDSVLEQLRIAKLGSSADLKVGQATVTISNALGYGQYATTGIISALNREVDLDDTIMELIVTDAAINLGSSGGALLNASGEVIGICVAKETGDSSEGMGYFIPIDTAVPVLEQLISKETRDKLSDSQRGYIGATVLTVSEEATGTYNMPAGAFVYEVSEGSAAEEAGIQNGDIITAIEGETVTNADDLIEKMSYYAPGETITLEVQTANYGTYEAREVEVTLQESSSSDTEDTEETDEAEEETEADSGDGKEEKTLPDESRGGFNDGFDDGFDDYNSQFN